MIKLILFDIDGTLISAAGAGTEAMNRTLQEMTGIRNGFGHVNCAGKTDPQIVREGAVTHNIDTHERFMREFFAIYPKHLEVTIRERRGHVKPGVRDLLERLEAGNGFCSALLTGNWEEAARIKLGQFSLDHYFPFGAYGSDHEDRNQLLPAAIEKFKKYSGTELSPENCLLIGDTPRDVECAKVNGAPIIAVATGTYPIEHLRKTEADLVLEHLLDHDRILDWISQRQAR